MILKIDNVLAIIIEKTIKALSGLVSNITTKKKSLE